MMLAPDCSIHVSILGTLPKVASSLKFLSRRRYNPRSLNKTEFLSRGLAIFTRGVDVEDITTHETIKIGEGSLLVGLVNKENKMWTFKNENDFKRVLDEFKSA